MKKYIYTNKLLLITLFALSLSCEDKKDDKSGFGKINAKIIFEYNHTTQNPIIVQSPISKIKDQKIITDEFSSYVKSKIKPQNEAYDDEGEKQKTITSPIKLEKSKLASSIKYVIISVAELQPVEVSVSGTSASTTINDIPIGPQSVKVDLTTADKTVLYTETKTVNITDGVTATPTFNKFTAKNEMLRLTKPNGGESFEPGKRMTIQWERSHESIPVKIELFSNNQKLRTIVSSVYNSGMYNYDIPSSLNARNDYQIKIISTQNPDVFDLSDSFFEFIDVLPPATPTGLTATAGNLQVVLTWNANSESDLKEYKVFGNTGTTPSTQLATIAKGTETYTHSNLSNGLTYSYSISAVDNNGNESNRASTVLATPDDGPPATPTGLVATPGDKKVVLTWNPNSESDLGGYFVYGAKVSGSHTRIGTVPKGTETFTYTDLDNGVAYDFGISAYDVLGNESAKTTSNVTATPGDSDAPATPTGLLATAGDGQVVLTWNANSEGDLSYYKVWGGTDSSLPDKIADVQTGTETYTHTGLTNGVTYYYGVTAVDNSNNESTKTTPGLSATPTASSSGSYSLYFAGSGEYAETRNSTAADVFTANASLTIELWYKTDSYQQDGVEIVGTYDRQSTGCPSGCEVISIGLMGSSDGSNAGKISTIGGLTSTTKVSDNKWHHIALVNDLTNNKSYLFINGVKEDEKTADQTDYRNTTNEFHVSAGMQRLIATTRYNPGYVNKVRISNVARYASDFTPALTYTNDANTNALWNMSEGNGQKVADASGNGHDLHIEYPSWSSDVPSSSNQGVGKALSFNGNNKVTLKEIDNTTSEVSISAWVYPTEISIENIVASEGLLLALHETKGICFEVKIGGSVTGVCAPKDKSDLLNKWNHIVGVYNGGNSQALTIYLNDDNQKMASGDGFLQLSSNNAMNFGIGTNGGDGFNGYLDEVALWDIALSRSEVTAIHNSGTALDPRSNSGNYTSSNDLKSYWKMEDGSGTTLTDLSGYGNDGTIDGASWINGVSSASYDNTPINRGNALSFDGADDIVSGTASSSLDVSSSNKLTIAAWIKPYRKQSKQQRIFTHGNDAAKAQYALLLSTHKIYFLAGNGAFESGGNNFSNNTINYQKWNFVTMTYDGNAVKIYINSALDLTHTVADNFTQDFMGKFFIGARSDGSERFDGNIDEVGIWNNALTANEITDLYNSGKALDARSNSGNYASTSNLVGYWKMEDGSGTTLTDVSGYGNDGTINGASWTAGILSTSYDNTPISYGNSLSFDGNNDLVSIQPSASILIDGAISLSAWVKIPVSHNSNWGTIFGGYDEYHFNLYAGSNNSSSNGVVQLENRNGTTAKGSTDLRDNKWHHVMAVYDGSNKYIYVDGSLEATQSSSRSTPSTSTSEKLIIGHVNHSTGSNEFFPGKIDEAAIWSGALSQSEVTAIYNSGTALDLRSNSGDYQSKSNLKAYWKMEDGSGSTLTDVSGYGNNGSIDGASWSIGNQSTSYDNTPLTIDNEAPAKPADLKATPKSGSKVELSWSANSENDLASYNIYGGTTATPTTQIGNTASTNLTITNLQRGKTYYYRISAVDNAGNESDKTNDVATGMVSHIRLDHSSGTNTNSVGLSNGGTIYAASRWVDHRYELHGIGSDNNLYLTYLRFHVSDRTQSTFKLKAWKGDMQAYPTSSNAVMTQNLGLGQITSAGTKTIEVTSPVKLDIAKMFSFGVEVEHPANIAPLGTDAGAYKGYGDLYSSDGDAFSSMGDAGVDANFVLGGEFIDSNDKLIQSLTVDFTSESQVESSALTSGQSYYLRITGTASYCCSSGSNGVDAAYYYRGEQGQLIDNPAPWAPTENGWSWNGQTGAIRRPSPDSYNPHHIYYYYFTGDGSTELFKFKDSAYGDNSGSLEIEIWENN